MQAGHGAYSAIDEVTQMSTVELMNMLDTDELGAAIDNGSDHMSGSSTNLNREPQGQNIPPDFIPRDTVILTSTAPFVEITEQPKSRALRFRYQCEGRSAGSIAGENSRPEKKTAPSIKIHNYAGPLIAVVSCVTNEQKPKPHPHSLVGTDCTKGVCTVKVKDRSTIAFNHLGIQCARKKDVEDFLTVRKQINVDPYQTGFDHMKQACDLNVVKLCFQVFLPDSNGKFTRILKPICSNAIYDRKVVNDLSICRIDRVSGHARGGDELFMLCDKIVKDDIAIVFQEFRIHSREPVWVGYGEFGGADVHKQYAVVFKTPPYQERHIKHPVEVEIILKRPSDGESSKSITFTYMPEDPDQFHVIEKKKRKNRTYDPLIQETLPSTALNAEVKERLRMKASRKIKSELGEINLAVNTVTSSMSNNVGHNSAYAMSTDQLTSHATTVPLQAASAANFTEIPSGQLTWLNSYDIDSAHLPMPTQVSSNEQYATLQLADINCFLNDPYQIDMPHYQTNIQDEHTNISLSEIVSADLLMTSYDPPIGATDSMSSDL